jgi:RimJ/RimL family protein N-acetyltransferase
LKFAFEESPLEEVVATIHEDNAASQKVLEKSGLINQGMVRAYADDIPGFRITRHQWRQGCPNGE